MPRHLISDAHEWINEIPSVPIYCWATRLRVSHKGKPSMGVVCGPPLKGPVGIHSVQITKCVREGSLNAGRWHGA